MQLITAPSKTQNFNGRIYPEHSQPLCLATSKRVNSVLQAMTKEQLASLMKTSTKLTESTFEKIHSFNTPFTAENSHQAIFTFQGDAYDAITAATYSEQELGYAQGHVNILSGLYGLLRPLDLMQSYRLEMGAKLAVAENKNLYQLWKNEVTAVLNSRLTNSGEAIVINLASSEYSKVIDRKHLEGTIVEIVFQQESKGKMKTIPIYSKRARGLMIHYAIINSIEKAKQLQEFDLDGYQFDDSLSTDAKWLFCRKG